jgi:glutamine synthetase
VGAPVRASDTFRWFLGGLLAHARELALCFAPNPNSYKRYRRGTFAPTGIAWSYDNRTAGFRVVGRGDSLRVECRIPGADANPYLACAALPSGLTANAVSTQDRASAATPTSRTPQVPLPHEATALLERARCARGVGATSWARAPLRADRPRHRDASPTSSARYFERI